MKEIKVTREQIDNLTKALADKGQIIEAGWLGLKLSILQGASDIQINEMRKAFFGGAQHLYASIMSMLDPGKEPTEKDMDRMALIHNELEAWRKEMIDKAADS